METLLVELFKKCQRGREIWKKISQIVSDVFDSLESHLIKRLFFQDLSFDVDQSEQGKKNERHQGHNSF